MAAHVHPSFSLSGQTECEQGCIAALQVAKAFGDMEAIFTYEGTYEVNALVAGRGITGKAAFKPAPSRQPKYVQA